MEINRFDVSPPLQSPTGDATCDPWRGGHWCGHI